MTNKRTRGRPRGSGLDDTAYLDQVADMLVADPNLKPTTAMRRLIRARNEVPGASDDAAIRRWQEKWKVDGTTLLAAARLRAEPVEHAAHIPSAVAHGVGVLPGVSAHMASVSHWLTAKAMLQQAKGSPIAKAVREALYQATESPMATVVRQALQVQALRDQIEPTFMQHLRRDEELRQQLQRLADPFGPLRRL